MDAELRETIKARVRKLLNLAGDNAAFEGEISAAMSAAESLMEKYQLERAECEAAEVAAGNAAAPMGKVATATHGARFSSWETTLAHAIRKLVGTVEFYHDTATRPVGAFGKPTRGAMAVWYGPADDCERAAEMFGEWGGAIATLAVGKYGGCFRGDGGAYAQGFADALNAKARDNAQARRNITTAATTALVLAGADHSLAALQAQTRSDARDWLRNSAGIKLVNRGGGGGGGYSGGAAAYGAGRKDGAAAAFGAKRTPRLPG